MKQLLKNLLSDCLINNDQSKIIHHINSFLLSYLQFNTQECFDTWFNSLVQSKCNALKTYGFHCETCDALICDECVRHSPHVSHCLKEVNFGFICSCGNGLRKCGGGCKNHSGNVYYPNNHTTITSKQQNDINEVYDFIMELLNDSEKYESVINGIFQVTHELIRKEEIASIVVNVLGKQKIKELFMLFHSKEDESNQNISTLCIANTLVMLLSVPSIKELYFELLDSSKLLLQNVYAPFCLFQSTSYSLISLLNTLSQQLQYHIIPISFHYQLQFYVRRTQAAFFHNIQQLRHTSQFFTNESIILFVQFLHDLNAITNVDLISSNNKNISVLIIHEFLSETLQVFWEIISTMSTPLLLSLATEIQTHIELQHNNFTLKYYTDYYFGLTMFELLNNNQDITQFSQSFDYLQIFTFQRIAKYNQFSYDFSFDLQLTKFPMRGNPMVPVKTWFTSTFAFAVQFNLSFAKNTALFTELCYYLKEKGVSSFIKSCQKNGISENYAYDLLMRCIKFDSTSTLFQQSSIDIWKMSQYDVRSLIKDDIIGVVVNNDINTFISFDLFNPFMLLLDEEKLKKITNMFVISN